MRNGSRSMSDSCSACAADADDSGLWYGFDVIAGELDLNGDGVIDANDSGDIFANGGGVIVSCFEYLRPVREGRWSTLLEGAQGQDLNRAARILRTSGITPEVQGSTLTTASDAIAWVPSFWKGSNNQQIAEVDRQIRALL